MHRTAHARLYVNWPLNTSIRMLTENAKQHYTKISHIKFCEHIIHVYKTNGIISTYAHIYGTLHCVVMDANKNGQHLTLQVKIMQLKLVNYKE
jgi:hypothetical protein